jgi:hypothetical protein
MEKTTARTISPGIAKLVEELELARPRVITTPEIAAFARSHGIDGNPSETARNLRLQGWLLPLRAHGVWEFIPGSRAGRLGSGDTYIELRATLAKHHDFPGQLAYETAAWLHGLSARKPAKPVLSLPSTTSAPPSLASEYRIVSHRPRLPAIQIDALPVWTIETLLVGMAKRPTSYRDWMNVPEWLSAAVARCNPARLAQELEEQPQSVVTKKTYLLAYGDAPANLLGCCKVPPREQRQVVYFGPRTRPGRYVKAYALRDSLLAPHTDET